VRNPGKIPPDRENATTDSLLLNQKKDFDHNHSSAPTQYGRKDFQLCQGFYSDNQITTEFLGTFIYLASAAGNWVGRGGRFMPGGLPPGGRPIPGGGGLCPGGGGLCPGGGGRYPGGGGRYPGGGGRYPGGGGRYPQPG